MFDILDRGGPGILAARVTGKLSTDDYDAVEPLMAARIAEHGPVRLYLELDGFRGWDSLAAFRREVALDKRHSRDWPRIAMVVETAMQGRVVRLLSPLFHGEVRVFPKAERDAAWAWLETP